MNLPLKKLLIGKTDGKHEYIDSPDGADTAKFDTFLMPESVDPTRLHNGDIFFVEGFRGTGKTSLLRWHSNDQKNRDSVTNFVLFKSDLTEDQRLHLSREVGITWADVDPKKMEIAQDFKSAWSWFIVHKIGEILKEDASLTSVGSESLRKKAIRLLGLDDDNVLKKAIGFMPRLEGAHVKVKADIAFFEAELGGDFTRNGDQGAVSLQALYKKAASIIGSLDMVRPLYIYFDELEAFYHSPEQHRRDQRLVRDLLFSIANMNEQFRSKGVAIHIIGAVRSEVIDAMGSLGQEIDRLVHDKGFSISWHHANRSASHPLIQIIAKKIKLSEETHGSEVSLDPIQTYFPNRINGQSIDTFILDNSFYKPRDIVWRLSLAQRIFPNETFFSQQVLHDTEIEYSSKLWDEVRYELSATYSDDEIASIEAVLSGKSAAFTLVDLEIRFDEAKRFSRPLQSLLGRRSVREILADLYRIGAIGNAFRTGTTGNQIKNRWIFRGDPTLLVDKRMELHPALLKRLSAVSTRKRGVRGGDASRSDRARRDS